MHSRPNETGRLSFALICCAAQMLRERHTLVSFGGYMRESGEVVPVLPDLDKPNGGWETLDALRHSLKETAPGAVAFGMVTSCVAIDEAGVQHTMIEVFLEHRAGFAGRAGAEYAWGADGKLEVGEPYAHESGPLFFRAMH